MNRLAQLAVNRDGFAFDPATGESFSINSTAVFIIEQVLAGQTEHQIASSLAEAFDVETAEAHRDVLDFLDHLRTHRLL